MAVEGWQKTTLGDLCKIAGGSGFSIKYQGREDLPIPFIKVSDMNLKGNETYIHRAVNTVDENLLKQIKAKKFPINTLVFPKVGAALLTNKRRLLSKPSAVDNNIMALLPKMMDYEYLYQWSLTLDLAEYVQSGAVPSVNQSTLSNIEIDLPPLPEQKKIAEVLGSVDEAIAKTEAVIEQTQRVKQGLLQQLLTRGIGHTKFKQTELGEIPESWEVVEGEKLFKLGGGHGPKDVDFDDNGEQLFLKVDDFNSPENADGIITAKLRFNKDKQKKRLNLYEKGVLVFPKRGAAIFKNRMQVLKERATVDPNLMCLNAFGINAKFLMEYMLNVGLYNFSDNSGVPQLNNKHLYPMSFPVPSIAEQKEIVGIIECISQSLFSNQKKLEQLITLKKGLMFDLLTGQVRVNVDDVREEAA